MESRSIVTYNSHQDTIASDVKMMCSSATKNPSTTATLHFKEEAVEYHNMSYSCSTEGQGNGNQNSRMKARGTNMMNATSFIIDEQIDPLGERRTESSEKNSTKTIGSMEKIENLIEKRLRNMEQNLTRTLKKRIKKTGKKIIGLQKSMLSDIFFLYKDQPSTNDIEIPVSNHQHQSSCQLSEAPINSVEKFSDFEQKLKYDAKLQNNLISTFLAINCTTPGEYIRICWSKTLTDEVAAHFSWTMASTKSSICNRLITKTIKKAFALKFPLNQEKFNTVSQKYFQYAKDRTVKLELSNNSNVEMKSTKRMQKVRQKLKPNKGKYETHLQKEKEKGKKARQLKKFTMDEERLAEKRRKDRIRQQRCRERKRNSIQTGNFLEIDCYQNTI